METPGKTAPDWSVINPRSVALVWPKSAEAAKSTKKIVLRSISSILLLEFLKFLGKQGKVWRKPTTSMNRRPAWRCIPVYLQAAQSQLMLNGFNGLSQKV